MKLKLNVEVIKILTNEEMSRVAGGANTTQYGCNSNPRCMPTRELCWPSLVSYCECPTKKPQ